MMIMRPWLKSAPWLPLVALLAASVPSLHAQSSTPPPQHIDVSKLKTGVEDVVIPVPSEVFNALDKLGGNPNWRSVLANTESKAKFTHPPQIAMLMGVIIADGFIAVEAKDSGKVDEIGRKVIELATALGVRDAVLQHCNAITEAAKNDHWSDVRTELDKTQHSVSGAMESLHDHDAAELISIAGWLRGTDALSSLIQKDYQPDRADLLHQPDMLVTFERQLGVMDPKKVLANPQVAALREGLKKIKPLLDIHGAEQISQKSVDEINQISAVLVKSIAP